MTAARTLGGAAARCHSPLHAALRVRGTTRRLALICFATLVFNGDATAGAKYQETRQGVNVWNNYPDAGDAADWHGAADPDGYATGEGRLNWYKNGRFASSYQGKMVRGRFDGEVRGIDGEGRMFTGTFMRGEKSDDWRELSALRPGRVNCLRGGEEAESKALYHCTVKFLRREVESGAVTARDLQKLWVYLAKPANYKPESEAQDRLVQRSAAFFTPLDLPSNGTDGRMPDLQTGDLLAYDIPGEKREPGAFIVFQAYNPATLVGVVTRLYETGFNMLGTAITKPLWEDGVFMMTINQTSPILKAGLVALRPVRAKICD
jgi:hypothetical protein